MAGRFWSFPKPKLRQVGKEKAVIKHVAHCSKRCAVMTNRPPVRNCSQKSRARNLCVGTLLRCRKFRPHKSVLDHVSSPAVSTSHHFMGHIRYGLNNLMGSYTLRGLVQLWFHSGTHNLCEKCTVHSISTLLPLLRHLIASPCLSFSVHILVLPTKSFLLATLILLRLVSAAFISRPHNLCVTDFAPVDQLCQLSKLTFRSRVGAFHML